MRLLLRGGHILSPAHPHATAIGIEDGHIAFVGDDSAADSWAPDADVVLQLAGRLVTPAFVDAHVHLAQTGLAASSVDLGTPTLVAALDALADHARHDQHSVLLGHGWDESQWPERRPFTRAEVDRATGGKPAFLARVDAHSAVVSSAFLDAVPRLDLLRGYAADGWLTRTAHDTARQALFDLLPASTRADALLRALRDAAAQGIGQVHEMGAPHLSPPEDFPRLEALAVAHDGGLPEVVKYWGAAASTETLTLAREHGCVGLAGDLCADGAIGSRTSALRTPYADEPGTAGALYLDEETVRAHVIACTRAGMQGGFHVIGDRAADTVVAGIAAAVEELGVEAVRAVRHRLEHVEMLEHADAARLADWGVTASMQPAFDALWGGDAALYAQRLGTDRAARMNAVGTLRAAGVRVAFGSDTPVTPFAPWYAVRAAVHHQTPEQRIDAADAFAAHTVGGWAAAGLVGGRSVPGAPASLVVWDTVPDEAAVPALDLGSPLPSAHLTLVHGRIAHEETGALR